LVISDSILHVLLAITDKINHVESNWLVGGSCGLILQGVPITRQPRDLDIYIDKQAANQIHQILKNYATDVLEYNETERYRSYLSHYMINDVQVEIVADFKVVVDGSFYHVEVEELMVDLAATLALAKGLTIRVMPLAHEFIFNVMRNREDRYNMIAEIMRSNSGLYIPAFRKIVKRNQFSSNYLNKFSLLLGL